MDIQSSGEEVLVRLSVEEASAVEFDHGAVEMCIPLDCSLEALDRFGRALKAAREAEERNSWPST